MTIDPTAGERRRVDHGGAAPAGQDFPSLRQLQPDARRDHRRARTPIRAPQHGADQPHPQPLRPRRRLRPGHRHRRRRRRSRPCPAPARRLDPAVTELLRPTRLRRARDLDRRRPRPGLHQLPRPERRRLVQPDQPGHRAHRHRRLRHARAGDRRRPASRARMVASPTDDPGALGAIAETLSQNVNDGRVVRHATRPMVRVTASAGLDRRDRRPRARACRPLDLAPPTARSTSRSTSRARSGPSSTRSSSTSTRTTTRTASIEGVRRRPGHR